MSRESRENIFSNVKKCQYKNCNEEGKYWYPDDGIIYDLCKKHWLKQFKIRDHKK